MTRKAFTIVEVLVCVVILAVVGTALLGAHATNTKLITYIEGKRAVTELLSIAAINSKNDLSLENSSFNKTQSVYDILDGKYAINDDKLTEELKNIEVTYTESLVSRIDLADPVKRDNNKSKTDNEAESRTAQSQSGKKEFDSGMTLLIKKVSALYNGNGAFVYKLEMQK